MTQKTHTHTTSAGASAAASHTAGPWGLQLLETDHRGYSDWPVYCVRSGGSAIGGHCLATVGDVDRATAEQNEANARLIAAAPELLEAVKFARSLLEISEVYFAAERQAGAGASTEQALDAAIAKAEGRDAS